MEGKLSKQTWPQSLVSHGWAQTLTAQSPEGGRGGPGGLCPGLGAGKEEPSFQWAQQEAPAPILGANPHSALKKRTPYKFNQIPASSCACHPFPSSSVFLLLQFEYKLDREFLKGCKLSVTDDKDMVLALKNSIIESDVSVQSLPRGLTSLRAVFCSPVPRGPQHRGGCCPRWHVTWQSRAAAVGSCYSQVAAPDLYCTSRKSTRTAGTLKACLDSIRKRIHFCGVIRFLCFLCFLIWKGGIIMPPRVCGRVQWHI